MRDHGGYLSILFVEYNKVLEIFFDVMERQSVVHFALIIEENESI